MNDTLDQDALRRELALLCCQRRGLNPDHIAPGTSEPLWKTPYIMDTVGLILTLLGNGEAARRHIEAHAEMNV